MTEMEKVIKALECRLDINGSKYKHCLNCDYRHDIDHCQWACQTDGILEDALALLKAQEPSVMTSAEVEAWLMIGRVDRTPIVIEVRDKFIAWVVGDEYYDLPECDLSGEFYNKTWRCWTSRPDQATREAVKWNAQEQRDYEAAVEMAEYCERYEPNYNADDGSMKGGANDG